MPEMSGWPSGVRIGIDGAVSSDDWATAGGAARLAAAAMVTTETAIRRVCMSISFASRVRSYPERDRIT